MKRTEIKTITFEAGFDGYMVDVVETDYGFEAYIYKSKYGIKRLMFGLQEKDINKFVEIVESNLPMEISIYEEEEEAYEY